MFKFNCTLVGENKCSSSLLARGGLESLDFCRKYGLTETTYPIRTATWDEDILSISVDESLARVSGRFKTDAIVRLNVPIGLLNAGDLEELPREDMHCGGTVRLSKDMTQERALEIIRATLLARAMRGDSKLKGENV